MNHSEHILVCLSASPSNANIIRTAAKMAAAFEGTFTALYVQTANAYRMSEEDNKRLQENIRVAEYLGATITTVYGDDVSYQIAEFARLSQVTKIVIGRSSAKRRRFWNKPTLNEKLTEIAPNMEIHIIPDLSAGKNYQEKQNAPSRLTMPSLKDIAYTALILAGVTVIGLLFQKWGFTEPNIITVYILGVLLTSIFTKSHTCSLICALGSVLLFNFFFTEPLLTFHAYEPGYPVTFVIMLIASLLTGSLANKLKDHAKQSAQSAYRTKILLDTNQLLQKAQNDKEIIRVTASQLMKLLERNIIAYPEEEERLEEGMVFLCHSENSMSRLNSEKEDKVANWVYENRKRAGASTDILNDARCLYLPVSINNKAYGVIGIDVNGKTIESFEYSVLLSIIGECALAIENKRNAKEKELAAIRAKNEQLRANLLRAISHDLRTPLTSISGNASNLISNYSQMDQDMRTQIFNDIFDDSQWLIGLVENLLSVTRIEEGRVNLRMSPQLIDEVLEEAFRHVNRKIEEHSLVVEYSDELLIAKMDAKLIIQVVINIVDNAVKYTPKGSEIRICAERKNDYIIISIADNGPGIPDEQKKKIFDMFFTGDNKIVDSRRSLGLGLALCKSIISLHGGELSVKDNEPHGCVFTFTLPSGEVRINE